MPFENFPYSDIHNLNLDWLLKKVKELEQLTNDEITAAIEDLVRQIFQDALLEMEYDATTKTLRLTVADGTISQTDTVQYIELDSIQLEICDKTARDQISNMAPYIAGYYNVKAYGAAGDGSTDDRSAIQAVLQRCRDNGGGLVFFPAGTYNVSGDLAIPANTTLCGIGKASRIYMTAASNWSGEVLCVCGDNVTIRNLSGDLQGHGGQFIDGQANMGFIGISCLTYEGVLNQQSSAIDSMRRNVVVEDVYTDAYYAIQTETTAPTSMENVIYSRIIAPSGCISMQSSQHDRAISGAVIRDCSCAYLRIGAGAGGWNQDITIDNVRCCYARIYLRGGHINDLSVTVDTGNIFYSNPSWIPDNGTIACVILSGCVINGLAVNANNATRIEYGCNILASSGDRTDMVGCKIYNVYPTGSAQRALYAPNGTTYLYACTLEGPQTTLGDGYNVGSLITNATGTVQSVQFA